MPPSRAGPAACGRGSTCGCSGRSTAGGDGAAETAARPVAGQNWGTLEPGGMGFIDSYSPTGLLSADNGTQDPEVGVSGANCLDSTCGLERGAHI